MSFKAYFTSKVFLTNLLIMLGVTVVLLLVTMFAIRVYTEHGESLAVPNFTGMNMDQAEIILREKNLTWEIVDSLYTSEAEPGSVIDQFPLSGFLVKEGRTIFLTICARDPEQVNMPKLTDISLRQALNIMHNNGLNVGEVKYVPSEYPNLVLTQKMNGLEISAGTPVNRGSMIDLVVGQSSSGRKTMVPNLIGVTMDQARSEINVMFLNVGAVIFDESVTTALDSVNAKVWQQRPEAVADEEIDLGTSIDLWLTIDPEKLPAEPEENDFF
ncbi:PASTA domain-containing protein [Gaoshiqia sp. Z1-71]|uniref:PASTA domain-containing protein n=1 Tax=Gaoshiqia hydrogeniformans TaxID=3290090 RepID=UPI003BF88BCF